MKIAFLGSRGIPASYSGFETFYQELAVRLAARGHEVTVYNRSHHVPYRGDHYQGVRLVRLPTIASKHFDTITHTFLSMLHALVSGYDIHYVCIVGNSPLCLMPQLLGRRILLNVDGQDAEREKWRGFAKTYIRWTERLAARFVDVLIADSQVIVQRYRQEFGRETVFIPYGANPRPRSEAARAGVLERFGLEPDGYVLFVSRLTPENGAHVLIEAFKKSGTALKLAIVGDAPYADEYKQKLRGLLDPRIVMTGYLFGEEYREISSFCRFFVLPAGIDGTRPVLLDQMGFGNCVVVRDTPANMEVIGDAGLSFDRRDDVESLRQVIDRLSGDEATVRRLGQSALRRVREVYSWERVTDEYEALFSRLVTGT
jgi:glycosyltransferase involved in cell wall biosynthesis